MKHSGKHAVCLVALLQILFLSPFTVGAQVSGDSIAVQNATDVPDTIGSPFSSRPKVGLVLSGGGAKGIAHVGVIKALEDNGIPVDCVAGTSMGAIVGSLYSCGYSPEEMLALFTSKEFGYWSTGQIDRNLVYYFTTPMPSPKWLTVNLNFKDTTDIATQIIPSNLISPIPMNMGFLELFSPYSRQCGEDFNRLFVPFRCVASDVYHKHKIVFNSGNLGDAVRASMTFPLVFKPIKLDGVLVYDGGIYDNFPVDVMRDDFNPDFMIGVSVSGADPKPEQGDVYSQLEDMIIQNNDYSLPEKEGVKIQVPVLDFGVLDFQQARTIFEIGYKTGLEYVDSIQRRISVRRPQPEVAARREKFRNDTPVIMYDTVVATGARSNQNRFIEYLFDKGRKDVQFGMDQTRDAYYRAVADGKFSDLFPQTEFTPDGKTLLSLQASVKNPWSIGVGGWITSSTNSMLYLSFGYHTLSFNSLDVDLGLWLGQSYYAGMFSAKFSLRTAHPSYMQFDVVYGRQKYYDSELLFYNSSTPSFINDREAYARLNYCFAIGRKAKGYTSVAYGWEGDDYFPYNSGDFADKTKDNSRYRMAVLKAGFELNTLNDQLYPSLGKEWLAELSVAHEQTKFKSGETGLSTDYKTHYRASLEVKWRQFYQLHRNIRLGVMANGIGTLQPIYQNYTATLVHAATFAPTPSTRNYFNPVFRSDNYLAFGLIPMWTPYARFQVRGDFYLFAPIRNLREQPGAVLPVHNGWFGRTEFIGEVALVYNFPFASLSLYGNYLSSPAHNWNFGINFGLLYQAPRLFR